MYSCVLGQVEIDVNQPTHVDSLTPFSLLRFDYFKLMTLT